MRTRGLPNAHAVYFSYLLVRLETRIETMYLDKLDGKSAAEFFQTKAGKWRKQQNQLRRKVDELRTSASHPSRPLTWSA